MSVSTRDMAHPSPTPAFLTLGFRPFFLGAGVWATAALALWIVMFATGTAIPSRFDPLAWHIHEMLFGFVMAAICRLPPDRNPELDEAAPDPRRAAGRPGRVMAPRTDRLPGLGVDASLARDRGRPGLSGGSGRGRRPRDRCRAELAQPANGRAGCGARHRQSADAFGGRWHCPTAGTWLASWTRDHDHPDFCHGRTDRAELHPELACKASDCPATGLFQIGSIGLPSAACMPG